MNPQAILPPLFALAAWTGCILLLVAFRRIRAGVQGRIGFGAFRFGEASDVPADVVLPNRNYMNLLELPVLFYVVCLVAFVTASVSSAIVAVAWAYVALRVVHSLVHVTYNKIMHRFYAFASSNAALVVLWVLVGRAVFGGG